MAGKYAIALHELNDEEFALRIKAYNKIQHRNFTGYDQTGPAVVYGHRHATIHGRCVDPDGQTQNATASLFLTGTLPLAIPAKRFKFAQIHIVFAGPEGCSPSDETRRSGHCPGWHPCAPQDIPHRGDEKGA
ncbi:hypothetical protein B0T17DRAFT_529571 [Bombardia bombarda]|uniref:Uncharacterized protein n=1 Tax=Bombardia bombarda TaxID=252184 RepID=A0AA39XBI6_9PEZI|nr:hypothetical protein B0T17DRAFT_529571 [Bombardia bombarda]